MRKIITASIFATLCILISSCNDKNLISNNTINNLYDKNQKTIEGFVQFPSFKTKASESDIINQTTVSLIYPDNYSVAKLKGAVVSTGLTDNTGKFTLNVNNYFVPKKDDFFILEATKRIGNNNISLRTHIYFDGYNFKSITKNKIYINSKTTALAIISNLNPNILPIGQTIDKFDLSNTTTQINQISNDVTLEKINQVKDLVDNLITQNKDPLGNIAFIDGSYIIHDNLKSKAFSGCIGNNTDCLSKIPTVNPYTSTGYDLFKEFDITNQDINYISYGNISVDSNDNGFVVVYSKPNNVLESSLKFPQNDYYNETINSYYKTYDIFAQKYDLDGNKIGNEFKVSTIPAYSNDYYVKMYKNNTFKVVWKSCDSFYDVGREYFDSNYPNYYNKDSLFYRYTVSENYPSINSEFKGFYQDDCKNTISHIKTYSFNANSESETIINKDLPLSVSENGIMTIPSYEPIIQYNYDSIISSSVKIAGGSGSYLFNQNYQVFDSNNNKLSEKKLLDSNYTKDNFYSMPDYINSPKAVSIFDNDSNMYIYWYDNNIINLQKYDSNMNLIYESKLDIKYLTKNLMIPYYGSQVPENEAIDTFKLSISPNGKNLLLVWRDLKNIYTSSIINGNNFSKVNQFSLYTDNEDFYSESIYKGISTIQVYLFLIPSFPNSYYFWQDALDFNISFLHTSKNKFIIEKEPVEPFIDNNGNYGFMYSEAKKQEYSSEQIEQDDLSQKNYDRTVGIIKYDKFGNQYKNKIELKSSTSYTNYRYWSPHEEKYIKPTIKYLSNGNMLLLYQDVSITGKDQEKGNIKAKIYKFND